MEEMNTSGLDKVAGREIKKLYFVLLRIVEEEGFLPEDEVQFHAERLYRVFCSSSRLYKSKHYSASELLEDFDHLFDKLISASEDEEHFEKAGNLLKVRTTFDSLCARRSAEGRVQGAVHIAAKPGILIS